MSKKITRRNFIAGAATAASAPLILTSCATGRNGTKPPSGRIRMAGIGLRSRGFYILQWLMSKDDVEFVAICDVQKSERERIKAFVDESYGNTECAMYIDMREMLQRDDIDAVLIATGDRWHAPASILAMRAGKDVFTEKPSSLTIEEGRAVVETAKQTGRVYQTGTQRLSEAHHVFCYEMVQSGRLGEVHTVYAHIAPWFSARIGRNILPAQEEPPREIVDWDAWLGPVPWRPYNEDYVKGKWYGDFDFHTSCIGEWGAHTFAQAQYGLGLHDTSPVKYGYVDNEYGDGMVCTFANGKKLILSRGDTYWSGSCGARFDGERGWVSAADGYTRSEVSSPEMLDDYREIINEYVEKTGRTLDHMQDFLDCVRSRRQCVADPSMMHHSMTTVHCANIAMWLGRDLEYDPVNEVFIGDDEANLYLRRPQREPWNII
jgi:predicted dehydrogenase